MTRALSGDDELLKLMRVSPKQLRFGDNLKGALKSKGLNQSNLAAMLGVTRSAVSSWATNRTLPALEYLVVISRLLDVPLSDLINVKGGILEESDSSPELSEDVRLDDLISIYGNLNETGRESLYQTAIDKEMSGRYHIGDERDMG